MKRITKLTKIEMQALKNAIYTQLDVFAHLGLNPLATDTKKEQAALKRILKKLGE